MFIWASPPCTEYSRAKTVGIRELDEADKIVKRTWEITQYFRPPLGYVIENTQTEFLKDREVMQGIEYTDVDYCKYGMPYRKRTRLWNNIDDLWTPRPLCQWDCGYIRAGTKRHNEVAQHSPNRCDIEWQRRHSRNELYRVPTHLVKEILMSFKPE